jgi:surfactin synthase thioesterase subunit
LPDRALTQAEVEKLWARDRARLAKCGYSLGGLIAFYTDLRVNLAGAKK